MAEWFEEWFGEEYLELYPHRDDHEAERVVALIERIAAPRPGTLVLDICCGAGRHARAFRCRGFRAVGIDLSRPLLERARATARVPVAQADIRALPIAPRGVDLAVNLFTSFGYFADDAEHLTALRQMLGTVRPGGWFVLDFLNVPWVIGRLVAEETVPAAEGTVAVRRWLHEGDRFVIKSITTPDGRQFIERVRLFTLDELVAMIGEAGGRVVHRFGSYDGDPPGDGAPRVILFARTD